MADGVSVCLAFLGGRPARVPCAAVRPAPSAVRLVREPQEAQQHQAVRPTCVHHGQLRGADPRVPRLHQGCRRLRGPAAKHLPRNSPAEQDLEGRDDSHFGLHCYYYYYTHLTAAGTRKVKPVWI